jgi:hypothetical protein
MRNERLRELDVIIGDWSMLLTNAVFQADDIHGSARVEWLDDAFVHMTADLDGRRVWDFVFGRSDARDEFTALYHDERGVLRRFAMTWADGRWELSREDPDFHQRFVATVERDRITGAWEMSEDQGATWRKDFDLVFARTPS